MKIRPSRSGKSEFLAVYNKAFDEVIMMQKGDKHRLYNLRCSQLPYCPRSVLANYGTRGLHQPVDLSMAYYTSVGTTVHTVMQTYLPQLGNFLADYECKECGKKYPLSHVHECCGMPTQYEEVTIDIGTVNGRNGIQGHIDGIFRDSAGHMWIVDFKTCTLYGGPKKERDPGEGYKRQIRAYAVLLKKQYRIRVKGVMLIFIPRDNPRKISVWEQEMNDNDFKQGVVELKKDKALHRKTMVASTLEEVMELAKTNCGSTYCDYCKMPKLDFRNVAKRALKKLPIIKD
jgi:hypothetical protein